MSRATDTKEVTLRALRSHITIDDVQATFRLFRALDAMALHARTGPEDQNKVIVPALKMLETFMYEKDIHRFLERGRERANELNQLAFEDLKTHRAEILADTCATRATRASDAAARM